VRPNLELQRSLPTGETEPGASPGPPGEVERATVGAVSLLRGGGRPDTLSLSAFLSLLSNVPA
jgi:hypothetical protein